MAETVDGDIRISIDFDAAGTIKDADSINKAFKNMGESIKSAYTKVDKDVAKLTDRHLKAQEAVKKQENELIALTNKYNAITTEGQQTASMKAREAELKRAQAEYDKLIQKNEELRLELEKIDNLVKIDIAAYGKATPANQFKLEGAEKSFEESGARLDELRHKIISLKTEAEEVKLNPEMSPEAQKIAADIELGEQKLLRLRGAAQQSGEALQQASEKGRKTGNTIQNAAQNTANTIKKETKKTQSAFKGAGKGIGRTLKRIKQLILAAFLFNVISKSLQRLQESLSAMLSTNSEYAKSLGEIKGNLKTAFYPIYQAVLPAINALMRALATATRYIAAFFAALSGKSLSDTAKSAEALDKEAKALDGAGKSAKNAAKSFAGFDEINQLSSNDEKTPTVYPTEEGDTSGVQNFVDKLKGIFSGFSEWLQETFGGPVESIIQMAKRLKETLTLIFSFLKNNVLVQFMTTLTTTILPVVSEFINEFILLFNTLYTAIDKIFRLLWTEAIGPALMLIMYIWDSVWTTIKEVWDEYGAPVFESLKTAIEKAEEIFTVLWESTLKPIWDEFIKRVKTLWDNHLQPLFKELLSFFAVFINFIAVLWNKWLAPIVKWLIKTFGPIFATVFNAIQKVVSKTIGVAIDIISGVVKALKNIITFLTNVFKGDWEEAWGSLKKVVSGIGESIEKIFKSSVNVVIGFINGIGESFVAVFNLIIRGLNKISFSLPDWIPGIGGKSFGINLKEINFKGIPELAQGAVIPPNNRFLAVLGDQKSGTNIEAPLATIEQALRNVMADYKDTGAATYVLELDGRQFGRLVVKEGSKEQKRVGTRLITT